MRPTFRLAVPVVLALLGLSPQVATGQSAEIQSIQINQALGVQKGNALKFVAGKDTVVRAFLASPVEVDAEETSADVSRDGNRVVTLRPNATNGAVSVVDFACPNRETCGNWASGSYQFEVTVNGARRSTAGTEYQFVERRPIRVLALPVRANYGGTVTQVTGDSWKTTGSFAQSVYPVAAASFEWELGDELDASQFDLETDDGRRELWQLIGTRMPVHCGANPTAAGCYEIIIGFISDRPKGFPNGELQGYTMGKPVNIVVAKDEDAPATVAHEIAHLFGLGDNYGGGSFRCGANPSPDAFTGKDWDDDSKAVQCQAGRVTLEGASTTKVPAEHHAYEVGGRGALGDVGSYMGSDGRQSQFWVSQDDYDWIFDRSVPGQTLSGARVRPRAGGQRLLEFSGYIREGANSSVDVTMLPWEAFEEAVEVPDSEGALRVLAIGAGGERLAAQALVVDHTLPGSKGSPPQRVDPAPFSGVIRFPEGTRSFQVQRDGRTLVERAVSANAPTVADVTPTSRQTINGAFAIRWAGADRDGDRLTYRVEYNADITNPESDWEVLGTTSDPQWTEDFGDVAGGEHARLRVIATDGVLSGQAESAEFVVPAKAPEVFIDEDGLLTLQSGQELHLQAETFDLQDGEVAERNLEWSSDIAGPLGRGSVLTVYRLAAGDHVITLRATNSRGMTATDSITVQVR